MTVSSQYNQAVMYLCVSGVHIASASMVYLLVDWILERCDMFVCFVFFNSRKNIDSMKTFLVHNNYRLGLTNVY
jgi:hypothetical protein